MADGKVHMVSHDFIGLLVLGLFNVSIGRQQIRADLSYKSHVRLLMLSAQSSLQLHAAFQHQCICGAFCAATMI